MERSDTDLVRAYRAGDEAALAVLVQRHLKAVYYIARSFTQDDDAAQDIVQDVFIKLWRHLARYDETQSFRAWLLRIAHNTAIDHTRKKRPHAFSFLESADQDESIGASIADTEPLPDELFMREEDRRSAEELLSHLPPPYREVVLLRHYDDLSFEEISQVVEKPLNTVKSQHRRAMQKLRVILDARGDTAPPRRHYS